MTLQTRAPENFCSCRWGDERTVKRAQMVSEDPHRRERKFSIKTPAISSQDNVIIQLTGVSCRLILSLAEVII